MDLAALATGGEAFYAAITRQIFDHYYRWIDTALKVDHESELKPMADLAVAIIEGVVLLDAIGYGSHIASALEGLANQYGEG